MNYNIPEGNWETVKEDENYMVSDDGRMFSKRSDRLMKVSTKDNGYKVIGLWSNNKGKQIYVHRLVLSHFCDSEINDTVNHKDGDKSNNHISNLEWMTYSENNQHAYDNKLTGSNKNNVNMSMRVNQSDLEGKLIKTYPSMRQAERETGVTASEIGLGIRKGWKYGGFKWSFADGGGVE